MFFFNDTATTEIYTLSLHDALPIFEVEQDEARHLFARQLHGPRPVLGGEHLDAGAHEDRKSTRLNSSHTVISYAVFCLKKKKKSNEALRSCINIMRSRTDNFYDCTF